MRRISIIIVEDDKELLKGTVDMLAGSESVQAVATYTSAEDFLNEAGKIQADVVIMDIGLPGQSGIECLRGIKPRYPKMQFMMWTTFEDDEKIFDALRAGASGYILKTATTSEFLKAIEDLSCGGAPMSSSIARKVISSFHSSNVKQSEYNLSKRESEILELLAKGYRYKEIADKLNVSTETIRSHAHNIYEKLQVTCRMEAVNKVFNKK